MSLPPLPGGEAVAYVTDSLMRRLEVRYMTSDQVRDYAAAAVAAERERWAVPAEMAVQELAHCATWTAGGVACKALRDVLRA